MEITFRTIENENCSTSSRFSTYIVKDNGVEERLLDGPSEAISMQNSLAYFARCCEVLGFGRYLEAIDGQAWGQVAAVRVLNKIGDTDANEAYDLGRALGIAW